ATEAVGFAQKRSEDGKEAIGWQAAGRPLEPEQRFIEIRKGGWDHDHCVIAMWTLARRCRTAIAKRRSRAVPTRLVSGYVRSATRSTSRRATSVFSYEWRLLPSACTSPSPSP